MNTKVDSLSCCGARVDEDVACKGVVAVGSYVQLIVTFRKTNGVNTIGVGQSLYYQCTCNGIANDNLSFTYMRCFVSVVGVLVRNINFQSSIDV